MAGGRKPAREWIAAGMKNGSIVLGSRRATSPLDGRRFNQNIYCLAEKANGKAPRS